MAKRTNSDEKIASGLASCSAWTTGPASILPSGTACSTNSKEEMQSGGRSMSAIRPAVSGLPMAP